PSMLPPLSPGFGDPVRPDATEPLALGGRAGAEGPSRAGARARLEADSRLPSARIAGAAEGGTQEISIEELRGMRADLGDAEGLDPRLVRAALDVQLESSEERSLPAPRAADKTQQIRMEELEPFAPGPELAGAAAPAPRPRASSKRTSPIEARAMQPIVLPEGIKPIPKPKRESGLHALPPSEVLFDDSRGGALSPGPKQPAAQPPREVLCDDSRGGAPHLEPRPLPARARARTSRPPPSLSASPRSAAAGGSARASSAARHELWPLLVAGLLGLLIVAGSILYVLHRRSEAIEREEQRLERRYEQLRRERASGQR
ncbi:MAG: hypothetical protein OEY14_14330, partial [Myxococcales bacterium]|nr:hypothetical protein [Myxococcales bacterium]